MLTPATVHPLRHRVATHRLEAGTDLVTIKKLLGHTSIQTTLFSRHLQGQHLATIVNPLDRLPEVEG